MKTINELREMSVKDLQNEVLDLRKQQFALRLKKANGTLDKTHLVTQVRRAIARVKTIISEQGR